MIWDDNLLKEMYKITNHDKKKQKKKTQQFQQRNIQSCTERFHKPRA